MRVPPSPASSLTWVSDTESDREPAPVSVPDDALWPILAAIVTVMVLSLMRPRDLLVMPAWIMPAVEVILILTVAFNRPRRLSRRAGLLRGVAVGIVAVLVTDALLATMLLVTALIEGGAATNSAAELLTAGGIVWTTNVLAFALLYWLVDGGGEVARAQDARRALDLAFPQQLNPEVAPPGWRPRFVDYLYLGLTASMAFSPTDVLPLVPWAKVAMGLQSIISLVVVGLVVARAVNVFS